MCVYTCADFYTNTHIRGVRAHTHPLRQSEPVSGYPVPTWEPEAQSSASSPSAS